MSAAPTANEGVAPEDEYPSEDMRRIVEGASEPIELKDGCGYQGYEFGANYLDSVCLDGYLWDADSGDACDGGWMYTNGGDLPCPQCNRKEWIGYHRDTFREDAYQRLYEGLSPFQKPIAEGIRLRVIWWQLLGAFDYYRDAIRGRT